MRVSPEPRWLCIDARRDGLHLSKTDGKQGEYCCVLQTLFYTLSLTGIGCCLPWAVRNSLQLHASQGKNPVTPWKATFTLGAIQEH